MSQAAYALAAGVRLGGVNHYGGLALPKPLLGRDHPEADAAAVQRILDLTTRLEVGWLALALPLLALATLLAPAASWLTGAQ